MCKHAPVVFCCYLVIYEINREFLLFPWWLFLFLVDRCQVFVRFHHYSLHIANVAQSVGIQTVRIFFCTHTARRWGRQDFYHEPEVNSRHVQRTITDFDLMGIKERGIVLGFAAVICLVGSTIHTAPFGVGPAGRVREDRPDSAISSVQAGGGTPGSVWGNIDKKTKKNRTA